MGTTTRAAFTGAGVCFTVTGLAVLTVALGHHPVRAVVVHLDGGQPWSAMPLETLLGALAASALAASTAWLAIATLAALVETLTGLGSSAVRAVTPAAVRRLVALCCGLVVSSGGGTLAPAAAELPATHAGAAPPPLEATTAGLLHGLPLPDRATDAARTGRVQPTGTSAGTPTETPAVPRPSYRVRTGDSLWSIAERLLPPTASAAQVNTAWRAVYRANRAEVGPDPDLLRDGTALTLPRHLRRPSTGDGAPTPGPHRKDAS